MSTTKPVSESRSHAPKAPITASNLPHHILANILYYIPKLSDLLNCHFVCKHWYNYLANENADAWRLLCEDALPTAALEDSYLLSETPSFKAKYRAFRHAWNPQDCSKNVYIKLNSFTLHRNPVAQSTDGCRGKMGFKIGRHAWEIWWEGPLGTVAVVGVATKHAALQCHGYMALLGSDDQGWGWNLVDNSLLHNGKIESPYPTMNNPPKYQVGERIRVILDCDSEPRMLYFEKAPSEFLGVAFRDLPPVKLYPCVSAVYGNTEISMVYLGTPLDG